MKWVQRDRLNDVWIISNGVFAGAAMCVIAMVALFISQLF